MRDKRTGSSRNKWLLSAAAVLGALLIGTASYAGFLYQKADSTLERISVAGPSSSDETGGKTETVQAKPITFLLAGVDHRDGSGGSMNTDVLMLVAWNPQAREATLLSLPRDLELKPKSLSSQKANYYYAYFYNKDKETAIAETKTFFGDLLQLPIDYMAVIDFDGFRQWVDQLGGLEIDVDMDMRYTDEEDGTRIDLKKGLQKLNGKQTLDFVRYRKSNDGTAESSDLERNARQQQVLGKLLDKMTSLGGIAQWSGLLDTIGRSVRTDVPADRLREWALQAGKLKPEKFELIPLEGRWDSPYIVPKEDDLAGALAKLRATVGLTGGVNGRLSDRIGLDRADSSTVTGSTYR
ncbi:LCP family protein [Paenibacillus flagellatus]|uniref:LytR family transcriptional regulator n=1 Tax=Paenibacillus flagellatus TaxID=2211139 RepID=A0A2V5K095_9BACL|nr:LCP family protein [Paenibacillus flagellatus]PYI52589.1 LytR family transcriptional regulator [Paenibacillus flagellatus]